MRRSHTLIHQYIYINILTNENMARTKQTARKAVAQMIPRAQLQKAAIAKRGRKQANDQSDSEPQDANTQQFSLRFDDQIKCEQNFVTGQIIRCQQCEAILTNQSRIYEEKQYEEKKKDAGLNNSQQRKFLKKYQKVWICEFCSNHNNLKKKINPPALENPCYLLLKADKKKAKNMDIEDENSDNKVLIFCIDVSGSMDQIPKGNTQSRLACLKQAISGQISRMKVEKEKWKVGLVTFGRQVKLIGNYNLSLQMANFDSFQGIIKQISKLTEFCQPIDKCFKSLKKTIEALKTFGITALGPGLLSSIQLASKGANGSKVIICTDGQANLGLRDAKFYTSAAEYAKKKKVSVNVVALKGDNCNLKQLGKVSLSTGGAILKIDPKTLGTEFSKITKEQILGTESLITVKLNKIFNFCSVPAEKLSKDKTTMKDDYGNFSAETELTFQFQVIDYAQACKNPNIDENMFKMEKVPMQVQLTYTGRDGSRFLQVITDWRQLTSDQKAMYEGANFSLFSVGILQKASKKIKDQEFDEAAKIIKGFWSSVNKKFSKTEKKGQIARFSQKVKKLEQVLKSKVAKKSNINNSQRNSQTHSQGTKSVKKRSTSKGSLVESKTIVLMDSDSEQQCLLNLMRARSRSNSEQSKSNAKKPEANNSKRRNVSKVSSVSDAKSKDKNQKKITLKKSKVLKQKRSVSITPPARTRQGQRVSQSRSRSRNKK